MMEEILAKIDHHIHTIKHSPDSEIDPILLVKRAREIGLDGVVITEHDYQWGSDELAELAAHAAPLLVFSGAEISCARGISWFTAFRRLNWCPRGSLWPSCSKRSGLTKLRSWRLTHFDGINRFDEIVAEHGPAFDAPRAGEQQCALRNCAIRLRIYSENTRWVSTGSSDAARA